MKGIAFTLLAVLALVQVMVGPGEAAISCSNVSRSMASCVTYLTRGGAPPAQCCAGVRNVNSLARTRPDRIATCNCLKQMSGRIKNIRDDAATSLPSKCGVLVAVPISRNTDCNRIP